MMVTHCCPVTPVSSLWKPTPLHPNILSEYELAMKAIAMRCLVVTDVDETVTHKPNATTVELNTGTLTSIAPTEKDDGVFVVFSTGRTRLSALNWEKCELGVSEMNRVRAPDVLVFENGQEAYYNAYRHKGWGDFMLALANETQCRQHRFTYYDAVLEKYYCHQADAHSPKPPLNSAARERLLEWFKGIPLSTMAVELSENGVTPLTVEWLETASEEHRQGLEVLINTLRQQHLHITHGLHIAVPVHINHSEWVEHVLMVFLQGDAKPLLLSLGCAPASGGSGGSLMTALPEFVSHPCPHTLLEELLPFNQRSTVANSGHNALAHVVRWAEAHATNAFNYLRPQGIHIQARLQSKHLEEDVARAGTNGPRAYILLQGLVDKGKSLHHLLEAIQDCSLKAHAFPNLQAFYTLGDGNVDEALLSIPHLELNSPYSPIVNQAYVVQNHISTTENRLFTRVQTKNPSAQLVQGFPSLWRDDT